MQPIKTVIALAAATLVAVPAFAQSTADMIQRDVNQQQRIEQGLKSGQLTTREAAGLERGEARIDRMQSNALKDGTLNGAERRRISDAQNAESRRIDAEKHDAQVGNPNSPSSQRMQADVQRNINQQQRIEQGVKNGSLTNREAGRLEHGQAHVDRMEARAGRDGHVGPREERRIQTAENHQSGAIHRQRHDAATRH
jgi:hypothetical protein